MQPCLFLVFRAHHELVCTAVIDEMQSIALGRVLRTAAATVNENLTRNERIESDPVFSFEVSDYGEGWWLGRLAVIASEMVSHCKEILYSYISK